MGLTLAAWAPAALADAPAAAAPSATRTTAIGPAPVVPAIDTRTYRALTLANGIQVVLVSDPKADKSAASLAVRRGSYDEPADIPGLAHFLEHMLFLGTAKYPAADEYQAFISTHGGSHNAYTAGDHTNYFFDIAPEQFAPALDRFAQFFVAPRFDAEYVAREMNAVNSEYQLQLRDDAWRENAVEKTALNPAHPAARFSIGSLQTLADTPQRSTRDALIAFYEAAYAPQDMVLTVYGRESLDALQQLVEGTFTAVPARPGLPRAQLPPLAAPGGLPRLIVYKPERDQHTVTFSFPLPGVDAVYRENPLEYLADLIGHEGEGSLHALLKARGWIDSLGASGGRMDTANAVLTVQVELTAAGVGHEAEIGDALFAYIDLLRRDGVQPRLYDEQARLARLAFDYQEPSRAIRYVTGLSENQLVFPLADVLRGPYAHDRFDAGLIRAQLAGLTPDNVLVTIANPDATPGKRERWFDVPYDNDALPAAWRARWRAPKAEAALHLPAPNPFVPSALALLDVPSPAGTPVPLPAQPGLSLWHLPDADFRAPRASLVLRLQSDLPAASATNSAAVALLAALVNDELNAYAYPASLAGLNYDVRQDTRGLLVSVGGYSEKEPVLLQRVLEALVHLRIDPAKFERYREQLVRDWENVRKARPYEQAMAELGPAVLTGRYTPEQLVAGIRTLDPAALAAFHASLLKAVQADLLVHGNVDAAGATRLGQIVGGVLPLCATCAARPPEVRAFRHATTIERPVEHDDAAMALYVQGDDRSAAERARYGLLAHMLSAPYFDALRTRQALGYVVGVSPTVLERVPAITFIVQSPVKGVPALVDATQAFLKDWRGQLAAMSPDAFAAEKAGLLTKLLEQDANLVSRTARLWGDLADGVTTFDTRERIADAIRAIDQKQFAGFVDDVARRVREQRLLVAVPGKFGGTNTLGAPPKDGGDGFVAR